MISTVYPSHTHCSKQTTGISWLLGALLYALTILTCTEIAAAEPLTPDATAREEMWLTVSINGRPTQQTFLVLKEASGRVLVREADARSWRLVPPSVAPSMHLDEHYFPLNAWSGLTFQIDDSAQALLITAPPRAFEAVKIRGAAASYQAPTPPPPGGFLNYDVVAANETGLTSTSALLEADAFGRWGAGVMRFLHTDAAEQSRAVRLDSTWTYDRPQTASSLRLGDSISGASRFWGGAVRFGGFQWASNFSTRPGLITFPLPSVAGEATLPSTFDLFVNGALRMRQDMPAGPFDINDIPVVTGDGEIRVVVRDILGREQVVSQSYYASPRLLRQGLHDYSYEIGAVRRNFGLTSYDYGRPLAVGTHRIGFTDRFTAEIHGEWLSDQQTVGLGGAWQLPKLGVLTAAIAGSHAAQGNGGLFSLGVERRNRRIGFGGNLQFAQETFTNVGLLETETVPLRAGSLFVSSSFGRLGSSSLVFTEQQFSDRTSIQLVSARHNLRAGRFGFFSFSVLRVAGDRKDTIFDLTFTRSLDDRTSSSVSGTSQSNSTSALMQVQRNTPAGRGMGYRVRAGLGDSDYRGAGARYQNDVGAYLLEAETVNAATRVQASASGSFAMLGERIFPSRRIDTSFAVAKVPDHADVRVYSENQLIGRTNEDGYVLLPGLRPYQNNLIRIEHADLPLDVEISDLQLNAVPYYRSGVLLSFAVRSSRGALISIVLENGAPLPAGAFVQRIDEEQQFPSGMNGDVYVTGLARENRLRVTWQQQSCEIDVAYTPSDDPLPRLGPYVCKGVKP